MRYHITSGCLEIPFLSAILASFDNILFLPTLLLRILILLPVYFWLDAFDICCFVIALVIFIILLTFSVVTRHLNSGKLFC